MHRALTLAFVVLSALLLGAHVLRSGQLWLAVAVACLPLLLVVRHTWATRAVQLALAVGTAEWLRTLLALVDARQSLGLPYARLALILAAVASLSAGAVALLGRWRRPANRVVAVGP
jgi:uncharacterized membrane protein YphA (DoxX/SURF4 family)